MEPRRFLITQLTFDLRRMSVCFNSLYLTTIVLFYLSIL